MDWKYKDLLNSHVLKWIFPVSIISTIFYLYSNKVEEELEDEDPRKNTKERIKNILTGKVNPPPEEHQSKFSNFLNQENLEEIFSGRDNSVQKMDGYQDDYTLLLSEKTPEISTLSPTESKEKFRHPHDLYNIYDEGYLGMTANISLPTDPEREQKIGYNYREISSPIFDRTIRREKKMIENSLEDEDDKRSLHDWNERFQSAIDRMRSFSAYTPIKDRIDVNLQILNLSKDFIHTAQMYGIVIISEAYLPDEQKTIKPFKSGLLGGEKYKVANIFFQFAVDNNKLFGSDDAAVKVAGHGLKGNMAYFNARISGLRVPLTCLVDYRGFRLIATSILPINNSTIIYGSSDAGQTIHASDRVFNQKMYEAAKVLNIKPHRVGNTILCSPADLEGHKGTDGNYYLIDFSRVFPPEAPIKSIKNSHLSRLLRPEFVFNYSIPLCSDAFSGFIRGFHEEANREIVEATSHLLNTLIPKFATGELNSLMEEASQKGNLDNFRLTETLHSKGINCRYLGIIRQHLACKEAKTRVLIEILARVIKNNLRLKLRIKMKQLKKALEEPYRRLVINYMNLVFSNTEVSDRYWNTDLKDDIKRNFIRALSKLELSSEWPLKPKVDGVPDKRFLLLLLKRLEKMLGMKFHARVKNPSIFLTEQPFNDTDLENLPLRVKHMNVIHFAEGFFYHIKGLTCRVEDPLTAQRFYFLAIEQFEEALDSNPNNKEILLNVALTYTFFLEDVFVQELAEGKTFPIDHPEVITATEYYLRAIFAPPKYDSHSLFLYAYFLEHCGRYEDAEDYYLQSLESDSTNAACLLQYGNFLQDQGEFEDAEKMFQLSSQHTALKGHQTWEWNYWGSYNNK